MDGRCETCKWWQLGDPARFGAPVVYGVCDRIASVHSLAYIEQDGVQANKVWLETHQSFGCAQYESRDT